MNGSILSFDIQSSEGIISATDGNRYTFSTAQWQSNDQHPKAGMDVDFQIEDGKATGIFAVKKELNIELPEEAKGILQHYINAFKNYANFQGRATRSAFWYFQLVSFIVSILLTIISAGILYPIYSLAVLIPALAVGARRLHDTNRSGWWQLIVLIPIVGIIVLIVFWASQTKEARNRFDI
ncbi:MAG: DUF805 domain-containing protein [Arcobacteraceae bacterium]